MNVHTQSDQPNEGQGNRRWLRNAFNLGSFLLRGRGRSHHRQQQEFAPRSRSARQVLVGELQLPTGRERAQCRSIESDAVAFCGQCSMVGKPCTPQEGKCGIGENRHDAIEIQAGRAQYSQRLLAGKYVRPTADTPVSEPCH